MSEDYLFETSGSTNAARIEIDHERFQQLNGLLIANSRSVWTYLTTVNGGGAAGMLAFIGAKQEIASQSWPFSVLMGFVVGLVFVGVAHAVIVHHCQNLLSGWLIDMEQYWDNELGWSQVRRNDKARVDRWSRIPWILGWASLGFFLTALVFAALGFRGLI